MKVSVCTSPLSSGSKTRGVGAYTRELVLALRTSFQHDKFIETNGNPYQDGVDLVHYPFFDPFYLTLPWHFSLPTVITIHDLIPLKYPLHYPAGIRGKIKWVIQRFCASRASAIITDSESSAVDISAIMGIARERIHVVPLASATSRTSYALSSKIKKIYHLPDRYILYVGDVNWNKNLPGLVKAFSQLDNLSTHLVLVGKVFADKPDIPEFRELTREIHASGKEHLIHMLGYVPSHHLGGIYRQATLYCQPSWDEGFGLPLLEAMKAGCPVLSSNRGSLKEVGGSAVAYFDPGEDSLKGALQSLLSSPSQLDALVTAGTLQVKQFTWAKTARDTRMVYAKVV